MYNFQTNQVTSDLLLPVESASTCDVIGWFSLCRVVIPSLRLVVPGPKLINQLCSFLRVISLAKGILIENPGEEIGVH